MSQSGGAAGRRNLYGMFWRWHFFAALIVVPFVLWQSATGVLYLWSERAMDVLHPSQRFVIPQGISKLPSEQVAAALAFAKGRTSAPAANNHMHGMAAHSMHVAGGPIIAAILLPEDKNRSTAVLLRDAHGLTYPVFVDPFHARVLGTLSYIEWLPNFSRLLHGGWPLGKPGSWLLELGDCWAIVMLFTGLYLWWPRGRRFPYFLMPRFRAGARVVLRDLHSTVAVLFSAVFLFFLVSALPWTRFWGGEILERVQAATGQQSPASFSRGGARAAQMSAALPGLDEAVRNVRARGVRGLLEVRLAPEENADWWLANSQTVAADHTIIANAASGVIAHDVTSDQLPAIPRMVAFGIHVHQGDFGAWNIWLNTAFAFSLVWLSVTGIASWWTRRPKGTLSAPPRTGGRWPLWLWGVAIILCVILPIFGLSVLLLFFADRISRLIFPYELKQRG